MAEKRAVPIKNTFSDFRLAVSAMDGYDGIGMGAFDDFCMVDIDHCVFGGKLTQMAEDVVWKMDSYTEFSPSGTGVRIVCKASSCLMIRADITSIIRNLVWKFMQQV